MPLLRVLALALALFLLVVGATRDARADSPGPRAYPVYILSIDTDDAEDQAEALSGAIRSRVRNAPGFSLAETTVTLSMLTAALKCPRVPDAGCLTKIAEQLKADRFVWGSMQKAAGNMVKVDLRLWARGKSEVTASDSYTDNLKDQNDERLQRVAQRLFERLTGAVSSGTLAVHAGDGAGVVMVDGQRRAMLEKGDATVDLPAGAHSVEVRVQGYAWSHDTVNIVAGKEARLSVTLTTADGPTPAPGGSGPSGRKVGGWAAIGVGGALLIGSLVEGIRYANFVSDNNGTLAKIPSGVTACQYAKDNKDTQLGKDAQTACDNNDPAKQASTLAWVFGGVGVVAVGVGLYLVLTDSGTDKPAPKFEDRASAPRKPTMRLLPAVSPTSQGMMLQGTF